MKDSNLKILLYEYPHGCRSMFYVSDMIVSPNQNGGIECQLEGLVSNMSTGGNEEAKYQNLYSPMFDILNYHDRNNSLVLFLGLSQVSLFKL